MQLLSAWKESLSLFKPAEFKLFSLITLKSYIDTLKVWLVYWGWLVVGLVLATYFGYRVDLIPFMSIGPTDFFIRYGSYSLYFFVAISALWISLFLSARPSIKIKNLLYSYDYWKHALWICCMVVGPLHILYVLIRKLFFETLSSVTEPSALLLMSIYVLGACYFVATFWSMAFYIVFVLDSDASLQFELRSMVRSLKMFFYNVPFCFIISLLLYIIWLIPLFVFLLIRPSIAASDPRAIPYHMVQQVYELLVVMPLVACIATNFYTKKLHERFALYFGEKS